MKVTTKQLVVTPKLANAWLSRHADIERKIGHNLQRPLNVNRVKELASAIVSGDWKFNGDSIRFNGDGRILDGQHRLHAIVEANTPIEFIVIEGLQSDVFDTIDIGRKRTHSDCLAIRGEKNCAILAAAISLTLSIEGTCSFNAYKITNQQIESGLERHPKLRKWCEWVNGADSDKKRRALVPGSILATLSYAFSEVNHDTAMTFMDGFLSGSNLKENSPILMLRNLLINAKVAKSERNREWMTAVMVKAWNLYAGGKTTTQLRYIAAEKFPVIQGLKWAKGEQ